MSDWGSISEAVEDLPNPTDIGGNPEYEIVPKTFSFSSSKDEYCKREAEDDFIFTLTVHIPIFIIKYFTIFKEL